MRYYKNKIFCPYYESCQNKSCQYKLTDEIRKEAAKNKLPLWEYDCKPKCFKKKFKDKLIKEREIKMNQKKLDEILEKHHKWVTGQDGGEKANLRRADLDGADLREANLDGANLRGADLRGANLHGANLCEANLRGADLRWVDLDGADLREADLDGADLRGADLRGANLDGANLHGANLRWANLCEADLRRADLDGADLDFSCLPLWCGGQFKADKRICQQFLAHSLRICELSDCRSEKMLNEIRKYIKGWHQENNL